ncbi:MAG: hypothetical protein JWM41_1250 [Gemmatimonadetes bacterium]|nr:hypothetical protein [Gemmatimonadota bacterium]
MRTMTSEPHEPSNVPADTERSSRRSFVFFGALAATALLPGRARAQRPTRARRPSEPVSTDEFPMVHPNESVAAFAEWGTSTSRLVRRATMGVTPAEIARATQLGYQGYLNYQLNHTRINDDAVEAVVAAKWPLMSQTSDLLFAADSGLLRSQLQESTIYRAAFSQRQLYQRMVEFWSDHFNQDYDKVGYLLVADLRDVIRANALGKFPTLLKASAHSASMMLYLDQQTSRNTAPNQNYAREIMELHTLGVDGGYTQNDVAELSRVLTGWTFTGKGQFVFNPAIHDTGNKTVLGVSVTGTAGAAGINEGEQMLDVLVNHPSTARFIATKMLKWLLDPNPTDAQVTTVASVYKATGGDIKSMIRVILNDSWLPAAPMKFKRPFHFTASSLRSANPTVTTMATINAQLANMGHPIFSWDTPDGFPDKVEYWAGNIVPRWNYANALANLNSATTLAVDTKPYLAGSPAAAVDMVDLNFFGGEMPAVTRTALLTYIGAGTFNDARVREMLGLAIGANAYQWY